MQGLFRKNFGKLFSKMGMDTEFFWKFRPRVSDWPPKTGTAAALFKSNNKAAKNRNETVTKFFRF